MNTVIPAVGRFTEKVRAAQRVNMFVIHKQPNEVVALLDGALSYRTEIIKPGHSEQFMVTGILFTPIALSDDGYSDPVHVITCKGNYSQMAECIDDYASDQGLLNFITNGAVGLHLMVLNGGYANPSHPVDGNVITVGPRKVRDRNHPGDETVWIDNPESYNCHWGDLQSFIVGHVLDQCCCGRPQDVLRFTYDTIEHLGMKQWDRNDGPLIESESWKNRMAAEAKYGSGPLYYVWHNLENKDLLEHGGSAPGWLTGEGEHFLALMKIEIDSDPAEYADGK